MGDESTEIKTEIRFPQKIQNSQYRRKYVHTLILFLSFMFMGLRRAQHFPAFLDLAQITGTNVEQASMFYTAMSVGTLTGTFTMGFLFDKLTRHRLFLLAAASILGAVTTVSIPWSTSYLLTIFIFFANNFLEGSFDTGGNASLLSTWGVDGKMFMQFLHFSFSVGTIIAPFTVQPFLSHTLQGNNTHCQQFAYPNSSILEYSDSWPTQAKTWNTTSTENSNITNDQDSCVRSESRIHIAYIISGALSLFSGMMLFAEGCLFQDLAGRKVNHNENHRNPRVLPSWLSFLVLALTSAMYILHVGSLVTIIGYIMAFSVNGLGWSKTEGSQLSSLFWGGHASSRLLGVFVIRCLSPGKIMVFSNSLVLISLCGLWLSVVHDAPWGVWACIFFTALGLGVIFPTGIIYLETDIMKVSGKITSVIWISSATQGLVNPPLLGYLMQEVSFKWYIYLAVIEGGLCFLSFGLLVLVVKRLVVKLDNRACTYTVEEDVLNRNHIS